MGRVQDALVKATSTVQQLIRVTMELQHGSAVGSAGSSAEAVRSRELQVTWGALAAIMNCFMSNHAGWSTSHTLQVVAGRHFISSPPEYDASKVRVWRLTSAEAAKLEQSARL